MDKKEFFLWKLQTVSAWVQSIAIFLVVLYFIAYFVPIGRDDTDGPWPNRSGLIPHTDALTGCQYLSDGEGGIIKRTNYLGEHIGCRKR